MKRNDNTLQTLHIQYNTIGRRGKERKIMIIEIKRIVLHEKL